MVDTLLGNLVVWLMAAHFDFDLMVEIMRSIMGAHHVCISLNFAGGSPCITRYLLACIRAKILASGSCYLLSMAIHPPGTLPHRACKLVFSIPWLQGSSCACVCVCAND